MSAERPKPAKPQESILDITPKSTVAFLKKHLDWKLSILPEKSKEWGFSVDAECQLRDHLQEQLDWLADVSDNVTVQQLMESYWQKKEAESVMLDNLIED